MTMRTLTGLLLAVSLLAANGEPAPGPKAASEKPAGEVTPDLSAALAKLKLPGVKINVGEWCVDVDSRVCLREGLLELIACTKDTKEHESIIMVEAKPSHIHTALLLLGAVPGNPAMRKAIDPEGTRFVDLPPRGCPVDVFLAFKDQAGKETEHPISDFIAPADSDEDFGGGPGNGEGGGKANGKFPTHTFLFAGSILHGGDEGSRQYLCDQSGSVISLATFGDELLCLPGIHGTDNGSLMWQVDGDKLPADDKIILRLRPQVERRSVPKDPGKATGK